MRSRSLGLLSLCCCTTTASVVHHPTPWSRRRRRRTTSMPSTVMDDDDATIAVVAPVSSSTPTHRSQLPRLSPRAQRCLFRYLHGSTPQTMPSAKRSSQQKLNVRQALTTALEELQVLRSELEALRQLVSGTTAGTETETEQQRYQSIANEVEVWADRMLSYNSDNDDNDTVEWKNIPCTKMLRGRYNADQRTETSLTWMVDSRPHSHGTDNKDDTTLWPCLRIRSTIDAPLQAVSRYLAQASHATLYNELLTDYRRLSTVGPQAQITLAQTPKILFVQPRTFVTFCAYRWRQQGRQVVIVNQALDSYDTDDDDNNTITATAFCFRGATVLTQDADDPQKTRIALLAHASPGRDVPSWACRTATHTLAALEPYQLCYKLNQAVVQAVQQTKRRGGGGGTVAEAAVAATAAKSDGEQQQQHQVVLNDDQQPLTTTPMDSAATAHMSDDNATTRILMEPTTTEQQTVLDNIPEDQRPVGIAHMGYACFWPNGAETDASSQEEVPPAE